MKAGVLNADEIMTAQNELIPTVVSFKKYIGFLQKKIAEEHSIKSTLYRFILRRFERHPELLQDAVEIAGLERSAAILELIQDTVSPLLKEDSETLFALSVPLSAQLFYCTDALYQVAFNEETGSFTKEIVNEKAGSSYQQRLEMIYRLILERLYKFSLANEHEMVLVYTDEITHLLRYYRLNLDHRFVDITYTGDLPDINFEQYADQADLSSPDLELLQKILPLSQFTLSGFSIVSITDVTASFTLERIKNSILNIAAVPEEQYFQDISRSLQTLLQDGEIEIGLLPFLKVNNNFVLDNNNNHSILVNITRPCGALESSYCSLAANYVWSSKPLIIPNIHAEALKKYPFLQHLKDAGISGYLIIPISYNDQRVGVLELASRKKKSINEQLLPRLENAIPLIAQVLKHKIDEFNAAIEAVIREKFTSLQPSVEWRFNEVAWEYLTGSRGATATEISSVYFKDVYPLYGAIDIRNSSIERNRALQLDLNMHFDLLTHTLQQLKEQVAIALIDEMIFKCNQWVSKTKEYLTTDEEIRLVAFFDQEVKPFLDYFKTNYTNTSNIIQHYYSAVDPLNGTVFTHRRQLENAIQLINTTVSNFLESQREALQKAYPNYFEKFRTDGIEYDIYIGQSISPQKPFNDLYLRNLRLWQLASMAEIARLTHRLLPKMERQLRTTQLILAHTAPIDISFRNDERRFDVEGAYNIRYEVVKKRIDKVHIKHTGERLTQPGTIALVYYNENDANEYLKYIHYLQENKMLSNSVESLDLEDLQGVSGLKAIRVGVQLD